MDPGVDITSLLDVGSLLRALALKRSCFWQIQTSSCGVLLVRILLFFQQVFQSFTTFGSTGSGVSCRQGLKVEGFKKVPLVPCQLRVERSKGFFGASCGKGSRFVQFFFTGNYIISLEAISF